ncbi:hypothetical protein TNCV_725661 [Trichonephila clavipes]|nr:hypothetical protein TNCV_725661 [Trichonephila clavipes]
MASPLQVLDSPTQSALWQMRFTLEEHTTNRNCENFPTRRFTPFSQQPTLKTVQHSTDFRRLSSIEKIYLNK